MSTYEKKKKQIKNRPKTNKKRAILNLTMLSMFAAIIAVMCFTPIGFIPTVAGFSITLMLIPVCLGAVCLGVWGGTFLGLLFGITSFIQAFGLGVAPDGMAPTLFNENPLFYSIMCFVPRILAGLVPALIFKVFKNKNNFSFILSSASAPIINTSLFLSMYIIFYKETVLGTAPVMTIFTTSLILNFSIELVTTLIAGAVINKALYSYTAKLFKRI